MPSMAHAYVCKCASTLRNRIRWLRRLVKEWAGRSVGAGGHRRQGWGRKTTSVVGNGPARVPGWVQAKTTERLLVDGGTVLDACYNVHGLPASDLTAD